MSDMSSLIISFRVRKKSSIRHLGDLGSSYCCAPPSLPYTEKSGCVLGRYRTG